MLSSPLLSLSLQLSFYPFLLLPSLEVPYCALTKEKNKQILLNLRFPCEKKTIMPDTTFRNIQISKHKNTHTHTQRHNTGIYRETNTNTHTHTHTHTHTQTHSHTDTHTHSHTDTS